jgi:hypothetical protein
MVMVYVPDKHSQPIIINQKQSNYGFFPGSIQVTNVINFLQPVGVGLFLAHKPERRGDFS